MRIFTVSDTSCQRDIHSVQADSHAVTHQPPEFTPIFQGRSVRVKHRIPYLLIRGSLENSTSNFDVLWATARLRVLCFTVLPKNQCGEQHAGIFRNFTEEPNSSLGLTNTSKIILETSTGLLSRWVTDGSGWLA